MVSVLREGQTQPLLRGAARYKLLVIAIVVATAALAVLISRALPQTAVARASILLEDPNATDVLGASGQTSQNRLVQNQLEVLRSGTVAARATELAAAEGFEISVPDLLDRVDATTVADTDVISVSYAGESEEEALAIVAATTQAFQEVISEQRSAQTENIVARLDAARDLLQTKLNSVQTQIDAALAIRQLEGAIARVLDELIQVEAALASTTGATAREALVERSNQLGQRLGTLRLAAEVESQSRSLRDLTRDRDELDVQLSELATRRSEVSIENETESSGIAFVDPAQVTSTQQGAGTVFTAGAGAALGFLIALGVANALANRAGTFTSRKEPEALGLRLLADIPRLRGKALIPVRDAPRSPEAEAFRFAASNLGFAMDHSGMSTVTLISASVGDGKSTLLANTAVATARSGKRVLVIDADFGNQAVTSLLLGSVSSEAGLTELAAGGISVEKATRLADTPGSSRLDILTRGARAVVAPDFFAQESLSQVMDQLKAQYDVIFIDSPPFLQVAYSGPVARLAGQVAIVISHDSPVAKTLELIERARFLEVDILGYLYNRAPMSDDLLESGGSMKDVLGDSGWLAPVKPRSGT